MPQFFTRFYELGYIYTFPDLFTLDICDLCLSSGDSLIDSNSFKDFTNLALKMSIYHVTIALL